MRSNSVFSRLIVGIITLTVLTNIGCSLSVNDLNQKNGNTQKLHNSVLTIVDTTDLNNPSLSASIRLPFHVNANNSVFVVENLAYVTTQRRMHIIDVSIPQHPSYLTSLEFPEDIGKIFISSDQAVVASRQKIYLIDISQPSHLEIGFTTFLPDQKTIIDLDVRKDHIYVLGEYDSLYIFSVHHKHAKLVKADTLEKRCLLISPKHERHRVEQILSPVSRNMLGPLLENRGFLQFSRSKHQTVRSSSEFLALGNSEESKNATVSIKDACRIGEHRIRTGTADVYNVETKYKGHLSTTSTKTFKRQKPINVYALTLGEIQQIEPNQLSDTIEVDNNTYEGPITDFQIFGNLLYIVNGKGFFTIYRFASIEDPSIRGEVLSTIPLQTDSPISIAIGKNYTCVLSAQ